MGLNYSVNLYFPQEKCAVALRSVAALATENDTDIVNLRTPCQFPNGSRIHLPFNSHLESNVVVLCPKGPPITLETALLFSVDSFLEAYVNARDIPFSQDGSQALIGYIDLTISLDVGFCEFSFEARTTGMSRLFVDSPSVRAGFNDLLDAHDGLFGFTDTEGYGDSSLRLMNPAETLPINRLSYVGSEDFDIDGFVADVRSLEESL